MHNNDEILAQISQSPDFPIDESYTLLSHICLHSLCYHIAYFLLLISLCNYIV